MSEREHSEHFPNVIMVSRSTVKSLEGKKLDQSFTARFNNTMKGQASNLSFSFQLKNIYRVENGELALIDQI